MANLDIESDELKQVSFAVAPIGGQLCLPNTTRTLIINNIELEEINIKEMFFEQSEKKFPKILGL